MEVKAEVEEGTKPTEELVVAAEVDESKIEVVEEIKPTGEPVAATAQAEERKAEVVEEIKPTEEPVVVAQVIKTTKEPNLAETT